MCQKAHVKGAQTLGVLFGSGQRHKEIITELHNFDVCSLTCLNKTLEFSCEKGENDPVLQSEIRLHLKEVI